MAVDNKRSIYSQVIELGESNYKHKVMEILKKSLEDDRNKRKLANLNSLIKVNRRMGKKLYYRGVELGMYSIEHGGKLYYLTPFLGIEYSNDKRIRVLYQIKEGRDTIKLARQKLKYIGLEPKVSEILETMSLR